MSNPLEDAVEILKTKLPEFTVRILEPTILGRGSLNIAVGSQIAVELPQANANLRLGLLRELSQRTGLSFSSDSRALDGACVGQDSPEKILDAVRKASGNGKLDDLNIAYLERETSAKDKKTAMQIRQQGGRLAEGFLNLVSSKDPRGRY